MQDILERLRQATDELEGRFLAAEQAEADALHAERIEVESEAAEVALRLIHRWPAIVREQVDLLTKLQEVEARIRCLNERLVAHGQVTNLVEEIERRALPQPAGEYPRSILTATRLPFLAGFCPGWNDPPPAPARL